MFDLRRHLMSHLQTLDVAYFDHNPVGRLVTRVTTDVDVLNDLFTSGLVTIIGDLLMLSFVIIAMFRLSPGMTLLMLAVTPLVVLVTVQFRRTAATRATDASAWPSPKSTPICRNTLRGLRFCNCSTGRREAAMNLSHQPRSYARFQGLHHGVRLVLSGG